MEPLSALSVATAVTQFIDFTGSLLSGTIELHKSATGRTKANLTIETIALDLRNLNIELTESFSSGDSHDADIKKLCLDCSKMADQLLEALNKLTVQKQHRLWSSFSTALRSIWAQEDIDSLQRRLDAYRQQISMHILVQLR